MLVKIAKIIKIEIGKCKEFELICINYYIQCVLQREINKNTTIAPIMIIMIKVIQNTKNEVK